MTAILIDSIGLTAGVGDQPGSGGCALFLNQTVNILIPDFEEAWVAKSGYTTYEEVTTQGNGVAADDIWQLLVDNVSVFAVNGNPASGDCGLPITSTVPSTPFNISSQIASHKGKIVTFKVRCYDNQPVRRWATSGTVYFFQTTRYIRATVYHIIDQIESTTIHPLYNVAVDIKLGWKDPLSNILNYYYTYPIKYTNSVGSCYITTINPFNLWEPAWWLFEANKLISGEGWNIVQIIATTYSTTGKIDETYIDTNTYTMYLNHTLTEAVDIKDEVTGLPIEVANVSMYQTHLIAPSQLTSYLGRATFTVYPENITHHIQKSGYRTYTPIYTNLKNTDCQTCGVVNTALLTPLPLDENTFILFTNKSSIGYYPNQSMIMNYNVGYASTGGFRTGTYVNILRPDKTLAARIPSTGGLEPPNSFYYSPPPLGYPPTTAGMRGDWIAQLMDNTGSEIANDLVFFGTKGTLGYNISTYCAEKKITIIWSGLNPVNAAGDQSDYYMRIKVYDGNNVLKYTHSYLNMNYSSGNFIYDFIVRGGDISKPWKITLTDQWGVIIDTKYMNICSCNQYIFGKVVGNDGDSIPDADIILDLTVDGYGTFPTTSSSTGSYMISGFPPFLSQPISAAKTGYVTKSVDITVEEGQFLEQNFILDGLLAGIVTDIEGNPINNATVWIYDKPYLVYTNDQGRYNLYITETGNFTLNCIKNNFIINQQSINIPNTINQVVQNFTLIRKSLETYSANFPNISLVCETSGIQLDNLSDTIISTSGQELVLADYTNSRKGSSIRTINTGQGFYDVSPMCIPKDYYKILDYPIAYLIGVYSGSIYMMDIIEINHASSQAIIKFYKGSTSDRYVFKCDYSPILFVRLNDSDILLDTKIVQTYQTYEWELDSLDYMMNTYNIIVDSNPYPNKICLDLCFGPGTSDAIFGANFGQIFESNFNFNHIAIKILLKNATIPCKINVKLFDDMGYSVTGSTITFTTPIFKDNIILTPGDGGYIHFYFKTQLPEHYCIRIENENHGYGNLYIYGKSPNMYYDGSGNLLKAYKEGIEVNYSIENWIYEAPMQTERYLIRGGAKDITSQYTADAKDTNLVIIE